MIGANTGTHLMKVTAKKQRQMKVSKEKQTTDYHQDYRVKSNRDFPFQKYLGFGSIDMCWALVQSTAL
jgi:hypothetical protein